MTNCFCPRDENVTRKYSFQYLQISLTCEQYSTYYLTDTLTAVNSVNDIIYGCDRYMEMP